MCFADVVVDRSSRPDVSVCIHPACDVFTYNSSLSGLGQCASLMRCRLEQQAAKWQKLVQKLLEVLWTK